MDFNFGCQQQEKGAVFVVFKKQRNVDKEVDNFEEIVDKWIRSDKHQHYTQIFFFIPSMSPRSLSFTDNSLVIVSTPCMMVV